MTVAEKIEELKALIGWNHNSDIRETINIHDFQRSIEFAIRKICTKTNLIESTMPIPITINKRHYQLNSDTYENTGYIPKELKGYYFFFSDEGVSPLIEYSTKSVEYLELANVDATTINSTGYFRVGTKSQYNPILNTSITDSPTQRVITSKDGNEASDTISVFAATGIVAGDICLNLTQIRTKQVYSSSTVKAVDTLNIQFEDTVPVDDWDSGDVLFFGTSLPVVLCVVYKGTVKKGFITGKVLTSELNTIISQNYDLYDDYIGPIALEYLYEILKGRFKEYIQQYIAQTQIVTNKLKEIKQLYSTTEVKTVQPYLPYEDV